MQDAQMRAIVCHTISADFSGVELKKVPMPSASAGQVRVRTQAASINFPDLLLCRGLYQLKLEPPFTPGMNVCGIVDSLGAGVTDFKVGDAVVGAIRHGGFAEYLVAAQEHLHTAPPNLSASEAASYPTAYLTAYVALVRRARLAPGETVLVHGASGGVGLATVDLAKLLGATVIATSPDPLKRELIKAYGAHHCIDSTNGFAARVNELTDGRGADVVFDPVGGDVFDESVHCIGFDGRLLVVGFTSGRFATIKSNIALIKAFSVVGVRAGEYARRFPDKGREDVMAIQKLAASGKIRPRVHTELPLARTLRGFVMLDERRVVGKVVIRCDQ